MKKLTKREWLFILIGVIIIVVIFLMRGCNSPEGEKEEASAEVETADADKPLNITLFLDLSYRITYQRDGMEQYEKDSILINHIVQQFIDRAVNKYHIQNSKDKIQVAFHPSPQDKVIATYAQNLVLDMGAIKNPAEKKKTLAEMDSIWRCSISGIYDKALEAKITHQWPGSDIWTFFKDDVKSKYCKDGYRNLIIVFTDGYIYYAQNLRQIGDSCTYIGQTDDSPRNDKDLRTKLIVPCQDLNDVKVLFLELTAKPNRSDIVKTTIETWLKNMGVQEPVVQKTDFPSHITPIIDNFIEW